MFTLHWPVSITTFAFAAGPGSGTISSVISLARLPSRAGARQQGGVRTVLLLVVTFGLGIALSASWFRRQNPTALLDRAGIELSPATRAVLQQLKHPVTVRFYSVLNPSAPANVQELSQRTEHLLTAYQNAAPGKVIFEPQTNSTAQAAQDAGLDGFDLEQGPGDYLGVTVSCGAKQEVLAQLSPQWESALQADLSRAIQRVGEQPSRPPMTPATVPPDTAIMEELQHRIPDLASVSLEDGLRKLREGSVMEFTAAVTEMQARVKQAQARVAEAKASGSVAEQDAALKQLQALQTTQAQQLKQLAANAQARIEAFKKLKAGAR